MEVMGGALAESGVVGWLWGMADGEWSDRKGAEIRVQSRTSKSPILSQKTRQGWGTHRRGWGALRAARPTSKRRGEVAEAAFVAKVSGLGFGVAKPWGDSDPYDFIVQMGGRLSKVQVKSAHVIGQDGCYSFRAHGHSYKAYRKDEIDALVAYVVPEDAWYVFPVRVIQRMKSLKLFPGSRKKRSRFEKYREAWGILRDKE